MTKAVVKIAEMPSNQLEHAIEKFAYALDCFNTEKEIASYGRGKRGIPKGDVIIPR